MEATSTGSKRSRGDGGIIGRQLRLQNVTVAAPHVVLAKRRFEANPADTHDKETR